MTDERIDEAEYEPSPSEWVRDQVELFESSGGLAGNTLQNVPIVVVTTIGAKTGKVRKVPVMRVETNGSYVMVASKGGAAENPVWYYNLKANPDVQLQDGTVKKPMRAREVTGDEKAALWPLADAVWPAYESYRAKSAGIREIPIFLLEPAN